MCIVPVLDAFYQTFDLSACARLFSLVLFFVGGAETYITYSILIFLPGRLQFFETSIDPTVRHTLWTQVPLKTKTTICFK